MGQLQKVKNCKNLVYQFMYNGKVTRRSTGTSDFRLAKQKAKEIEKEIFRARSASEVEDLKLKNSYPSIDQICESYMNHAEARALAGMKMKVSTARRNCNQLKLMYPSGTIKQLTPASLDKLMTEKLAGLNGRKLVRARNTFEANHRGARSIFSQWVLPLYEREGLKIPGDLSKWHKYRATKEDHGSYRVPLEYPELVERTLTHGRKLVRENHELALAWICQYELAMRASEIANLRWSWFEPNGEHFTLVLKDRPELDYKVKGTARDIQVHRELVAKLRELSTGTEFVLPQPSYNSRYEYICRDLAQWVRLMGWDPEIFDKAGYELRKLKGSEWFTEEGPAVAQEWLGHKDLSTTMKYYACLLRKQPPPAPKW